MKKVSEVIKNKKLKKDHRNKYEFQAYGNRLAEELNDAKHRTLYIKLAKTTPRALLEEARAYAVDAKDTTTRGKFFMWKLTQLKSKKKKLPNKSI